MGLVWTNKPEFVIAVTTAEDGSEIEISVDGVSVIISAAELRPLIDALEMVADELGLVEPKDE